MCSECLARVVSVAGQKKKQNLVLWRSWSLTTTDLAQTMFSLHLQDYRCNFSYIFCFLVSYFFEVWQSCYGKYIYDLVYLSLIVLTGWRSRLPVWLLWFLASLSYLCVIVVIAWQSLTLISWWYYLWQYVCFDWLIVWLTCACSLWLVDSLL